jgi:hypothetical protein
MVFRVKPTESCSASHTRRIRVSGLVYCVFGQQLMTNSSAIKTNLGARNASECAWFGQGTPTIGSKLFAMKSSKSRGSTANLHKESRPVQGQA